MGWVSSPSLALPECPEDLRSFTDAPTIRVLPTFDNPCHIAWTARCYPVPDGHLYGHQGRAPGAEEGADARRAHGRRLPPVRRARVRRDHDRGHRRAGRGLAEDVLPVLRLQGGRRHREIGRASCRERVEIAVVVL